MGCSQKHGPLLVRGYITAHNVSGYQSGILILGITQIGINMEHEIIVTRGLMGTWASGSRI